MSSIGWHYASVHINRVCVYRSPCHVLNMKETPEVALQRAESVHHSPLIDCGQFMTSVCWSGVYSICLQEPWKYCDIVRHNIPPNSTLSIQFFHQRNFHCPSQFVQVFVLNNLRCQVAVKIRTHLCTVLNRNSVRCTGYEKSSPCESGVRSNGPQTMVHEMIWTNWTFPVSCRNRCANILFVHEWFPFGSVSHELVDCVLVLTDEISREQCTFIALHGFEWIVYMFVFIQIFACYIFDMRFF